MRLGLHPREAPPPEGQTLASLLADLVRRAPKSGIVLDDTLFPNDVAGHAAGILAQLRARYFVADAIDPDRAPAGPPTRVRLLMGSCDPVRDFFDLNAEVRKN